MSITEQSPKRQKRVHFKVPLSCNIIPSNTEGYVPGTWVDCSACAAMKEQGSFIGVGCGVTFTKFKCNTHGCRSTSTVLPASDQNNLGTIHMVTSLSHLNRLREGVFKTNTSEAACVLITERICSTKHATNSLAGLKKVWVYSKEHPISQHLNANHSKPLCSGTRTFVYYKQRGDLYTAQCNVLGKDSLVNHKMVFEGQVGDKTVKTLWDSGATHSFISYTTASRLGYTSLNPSELMSVATATGTAAKCLGKVTVKIRWGPISTTVSTEYSQNFSLVLI